MNDQRSLNTDSVDASTILALTAESVSAYLSHNAVEAEELPVLIKSFYATVAETISNQTLYVKEPAVPVNESVTGDYIVCLEDGKKLKMLKRYLKAAYNMTPDEYRSRWGLPADYPMVASNYAQKRSGIAKKIGLGKALSQNSRQKKVA